MGKVHRIKRSFHTVVAQEPWKMLAPGSVHDYSLANGMIRIYIGVRTNGSIYIGFWGDRYSPLMHRLITEWEAGVALGDRNSVKS